MPIQRQRSAYIDFTPTPAQELILEAVKKGVSWQNISTLIDISHTAGALDLTIPWDRDGNAFLAAILNEREHSKYGTGIPDYFLNQVKAIDPEVCVRPNLKGRTPVDRHLDLLAAKQYQIKDAMSWWIENVPAAHLLNWQPQDRYGDTEKPSPDGAHLVNLVFLCEKDNYNNSPSELRQLFKLGISPALRDEDGDLIYDRIRSLSQWEAFIEAGGDPMQPVSGASSEPLWQRLIDANYDSFEQYLRDWAREHAGGEIKSKEIEEYWDNLEKKMLSYNPSNIAPILTAHPDFLTLRDDKGRNCAMYGITMHTSAWRTLEQKRFSSMIKEVDHDGLGLWHYALLDGGKCGEDTIKFLSKHVPCAVAKNGCGLIPNALLYQHSKLQYSFQRAAIGREAGALLGKNFLANHLGTDALWAISDEAAPAVFDMIIKSMESGAPKGKESLLEIINPHIDGITNPLLLGAAAALNMEVYKGDLGIAQKAIERGGILPIPDDLMTNLRSDPDHAGIFEVLDKTLDRDHLLDVVRPASGAMRARRM